MYHFARFHNKPFRHFCASFQMIVFNEFVLLAFSSTRNNGATEKKRANAVSASIIFVAAKKEIIKCTDDFISIPFSGLLQRAACRGKTNNELSVEDLLKLLTIPGWPDSSSKGPSTAEEVWSTIDTSSRLLTALLGTVNLLQSIGSNLIPVSLNSFRLPIEDINVILGVYDLLSDDQPSLQLKTIVSAVIHPKFVNKTFNNDIAILKLSSPVKFSYAVGPVCLPQFRKIIHTLVRLDLSTIGKKNV